MRSALLLMVLLSAGLAPASQEAPIRVVASTLDMADFAKQVGGDKVDVYSITRGQYDLHAYEPRPSEVMKLKDTDLLIVVGMGLDAFMPGLIEASRNPRIRPGAPGFVDPSAGIAALNVPVGRITGDMGDVHVHGNPHFWFTPDNVAVAVSNITEGLVRVAPQHEAFFRERQAAYEAEVRATYARLARKLEPYRGTKVLQYHESWDYFCQTFGLELAGSVEPKPGVPPSAAHLAEIVKRIRNDKIRLVLVEVYYPERPLRFLRANSPVQTLRLHLLLCGAEQHETHLESVSCMVDQIAEALSAAPSGA